EEVVSFICGMASLFGIALTRAAPKFACNSGEEATHRSLHSKINFTFYEGNIAGVGRKYMN
ncbi:MAG TPA: hypothetical protein PK486_04430, partial [Trichococcus flocculiformis]|nr:hypothetical protein [Trichococcus flocculiformis]